MCVEADRPVDIGQFCFSSLFASHHRFASVQDMVSVTEWKMQSFCENVVYVIVNVVGFLVNTGKTGYWALQAQKKMRQNEDR